MARLPIWTIFKPAQRTFLTTAAEPVSADLFSTKELTKLVKDMIETMKKSNGVGLAAPQIGKSIRLAVISRQADPSLRQDLVLINPKIRQANGGTERDEEGCLSIPGVFGVVPRPARVEVDAFDMNGNKFTLAASGLLARVVQHEIDHLNGTLFLDRAEEITQGAEKL